MKTGKTLLSDDFVNKHWIPEGQTTPISNISNVSDRSEEVPVFNIEDDTDEINAEERNTKIDWNEKLTEMQRCRSLNDLQQYIDNLDTNEFDNLLKPILKVKRNAAVDRVALSSMPLMHPLD